MTDYTIERFMTRKTEIVQVKITPELKQRFTQAVGDLQMSAVVRRLIEKYIEEFETTGVKIV